MEIRVRNKSKKTASPAQADVIKQIARSLGLANKIQKPIREVEPGLLVGQYRVDPNLTLTLLYGDEEKSWALQYDGRLVNSKKFEGADDAVAAIHSAIEKRQKNPPSTIISEEDATGDYRDGEREASVRIAADDIGDSKQPAMRPIFKKVAPQLVKPFQKAMRAVPSATKKKLIQAYFGKVKLTGDATSKKNQKLLRDTLVQAVKKDLGWMEFVAEQILDASAAELAAVLGGTERAASVTTAGVISGIHEGRYPLSESDFAGVAFPVSFKTMGQSDAWYRLDTVAREAGFSDGTTITLDSAEDAVQLFSDLLDEASEYEAQQDALLNNEFVYYEDDSEFDSEEEAQEAWVDENYSEYHSDDHEPAHILASQLGLD